MDHITRQIHSARVRRELDAVRDEGLGLDDTCALLEDTLPASVSAAVIQAVGEHATAHGLPFQKGLARTFALSGSTYQILCQPRGKSTLALIVDYDEGDGSRVPTDPAEEVQIAGMGRFDLLQVYCVQPFGLSNLLAEVGLLVIDTSYQWLFEYISGRLESLGKEAPERLYENLRRILPNHADETFLYAIVDGRGFYILDSAAQGTALERLAARKFPSAASPLHLWGKLSEQVVPYELLFSKDAFKSSLGLPAFFDLAKYAPSGLESAEKRAYDSDGIIVQPLVTGRKGAELGVGIAIDTDGLEKVRHTLLEHAHTFEQIVDASQDLLAARVGELAELAAGDEQLVAELLQLLELKPGAFGASFDIKGLFLLLKRILKERELPDSSFLDGLPPGSERKGR